MSDSLLTVCVGWTEAQGRNFRKEEAERFYEFNPNPDFEEGEQVEDEVLQEMRDSTVGMEWIVRHNDHNSLLQDKQEEKITAEQEEEAEKEEQEFQSIIMTRAQKRRAAELGLEAARLARAASTGSGGAGDAKAARRVAPVQPAQGPGLPSSKSAPARTSGTGRPSGKQRMQTSHSACPLTSLCCEQADRPRARPGAQWSGTRPSQSMSSLPPRRRRTRPHLRARDSSRQHRGRWAQRAEARRPS